MHQKNFLFYECLLQSLILFGEDNFPLNMSTWLQSSGVSIAYSSVSEDAGRKQCPNGFTITFWLSRFFAFLYSRRTASSLHNPSFIGLVWRVLENYNCVSHHGIMESANQVLFIHTKMGYENTLLVISLGNKLLLKREQNVFMFINAVLNQFIKVTELSL